MSGPLAWVDDRVRGKVQVTYKNQPIENLRSVQAVIRNTGRTAVNLPGNTERGQTPLTIDFGTRGTEILVDDHERRGEFSARMSPGGFYVDAIVVSRNKIIVGPASLNGGALISVSALVKDYGEPPYITANIPSVNLRLVEESGPSFLEFILQILLLIFIGIIAGVFVLAIRSVAGEWLTNEFGSTVGWIITLLLAAAFFFVLSKLDK